MIKSEIVVVAFLCSFLRVITVNSKDNANNRCDWTTFFNADFGFYGIVAPVFVTNITSVVSCTISGAGKFNILLMIFFVFDGPFSL